MKKIASSLLLCGALSLALAAGAQTIAPNANSPFIATAPVAPLVLPSVEQVAAAKRMLQAFSMPVLIRYQLARVPAVNQEVAQLLQHMSRNATDAEICDVFAPVYASYASAQQLDQLTAAYSTPLGRRYVQIMLAKSGIGDGANKLQAITPEERAQIRAIDQLPASKAVEGKSAEIRAGMSAAMLRWRNAYSANQMRQATSQLATFRSVIAGRKDEDPEPKFNYQRTGLALLDRTMVVMAEHMISISNATFAMNRDLASYNAVHLLDNDRLVSEKGIATSKAALAKCEERIERYLRALDSLQGVYRQRIGDIMKTAGSPDAMDKTISNDYELLLRLGENQRAQTELVGRILDFAQSRLGKVRSEQDRLLFQDEEDLQVYNTLIEQRRTLAVEHAEMFKRPAQAPASTPAPANAQASPTALNQ